ncbi:MAG TPA: hypothetical protein VHM91_13165 [Verrucomicrobiales bacterium]|nr:hypothetical protein [Verrucomicrobiales bacterium]
MFHRASTVTAFLCCLAAAPAAHAQLPPRSPSAPVPQAPPPPKLLKDEDLAKKLLELEQIGKKLDEDKYGHNAAIIKQLREAGVSGDKAFALWLDCKKEIDFDQKNASATEWAEWKRKQTKDANHDRDAGLQMQVQWLTIVLMHCNARTDSARNEAITSAVAFLDTVVEKLRKMDAKDTGGGGNGKRPWGGGGGGGNEIEQDVLGSVFAKFFKLDASVSRKDGVATVPGDVGGIYEKMILPFYRESKQAVSLMSAWRKRIEQEKSIADAGKSGQKEKFTAEKLPELQWGQQRDLFKLGQEEPATASMIAIIKANQGHRHTSQWITELTTMLKHEDPAAPARPGNKTAPPPEPEPEPEPAVAPEPEPDKEVKTPGAGPAKPAPVPAVKTKP